MAISKGTEKALEKLAKLTVERGWDPVRVIVALQKAMEIWNALSPEERRALQRELRKTRYPRVGEGGKLRSARKGTGND